MAKIHFRVLAAALAIGSPSARADFDFSAGDPDGRMAVASRPGGPGGVKIEAEDDFTLTSQARLTRASFAGLIPTGVLLSAVGNVRVEIYRVFDADSTSPPSGHVPTRVNSPSDVAFAGRDAATSGLTYGVTLLQSSFAAANSVVNGIHASPNQTTGGEGSVMGQEVRFDVNLIDPFNLPADHYFFVPQVELLGTAGDFLWLSSPRPIMPPGTPLAPDLQAWVRDESLAPDWLRVGTDIVGGSPAPTFNMSFSVSGTAVPEPSSFVLASLGGVVVAGVSAYRRRRAGP